jgi:hypothetical protein
MREVKGKQLTLWEGDPENVLKSHKKSRKAKTDTELSNPNFRIKKSVDDILRWVAEVDQSATNRLAAATAAKLVEQWRTRKGKPEPRQLTLFERLDQE